jgi:hypothetical protein
MAAIDPDDCRILVAGMRHGPVQIAHGHTEPTTLNRVDRLGNS